MGAAEVGRGFIEERKRESEEGAMESRVWKQTEACADRVDSRRISGMRKRVGPGDADWRACKTELLTDKI